MHFPLFADKPISETDSSEKTEELGSGEIQQQSWIHKKKYVCMKIFADHCFLCGEVIIN